MNGNNIIILDTTLRDGEQTPGINLNLSEKLEIARQLEQLGVDVIEAGFPAASPGDFEAVRAVSQSVKCCVAGLSRTNEKDIRATWEALKYSASPRIHLVLATSEIHMTYKLNMTQEEVLQSVAKGVALASALCRDVEFSAEDATRSEPAFLFQVLETAIKAGASTISIPDTVGYTTPAEYGRLVSAILQKVPGAANITVSVHCHNDLGLSVANTLAGIQSGARQIETTINGLGERAGNCPMEEVVMALTTRSDFFRLHHGIDTTAIHRVSQRVARITGVPVPINKAIVGANAFAHESGIHQHGVLKNPLTYEIMTPQSIGRSKSDIMLGKLSGRHAFRARLVEIGYSLTDDEIDAAFVEFKDLADRKRNISDDDLEAIVLHTMPDAPDYYKIDSFQIQSGNRMRAMACITLLHDGQSLTEAATGDGPVDAAYNAAARIVGGEWPLESYDIRAVTGGMDALGEVLVRVRHSGALHVGRGLSTDVIEASVHAFVNAVNRALAFESRQQG